MKQWLIASLLVATACGGSQKQEDVPKIRHDELTIDGDRRLSEDVVPSHYTLDLDIDPTKASFGGTVRIDVNLRAATRVIYLHADELNVTTFTLDASGRSIGGEVVKGDNGGIALVLADEIAPGKALISMTFDAPLDEVPTGLYRVKEGDKWYAFTQFEPLEARQAFPSFDEPRFKATFDTTIHVPKGEIAVSNSPEAKRREEADKTTFVFQTTKPLPTYLVAFAVGDFDVVDAPEGSPVPLRLITTEGKGELGAYMLARTPAILSALIDYFGGTFPFEKVDLVAVPNFSPGAMENVGLVTFREAMLLLDPQLASVAQRRGAMSIMIHELSHMWFGDMVTMPWWDDVWLNESFATWMAGKQLAVMTPQLETRIDEIAGKAYLFEADSRANARTIRNPIKNSGDVYNAFDGITYGKGARVLDMFETWIGPEAMRTGIQTYLKDHAYGSASTKDFLASLDAASGKPVSAAMATFLDQPGTPLLTVEPICEGASVTLKVSQSRYKPVNSTAPDSGPWQIPACFRYEERGKSNVYCELIDSADKVVTLPTNRCPKWVYPNANEDGYYLWNLPEDDVTKLVTTYRRALSTEEKVGLANNLRSLAQSQQVPAEVFVRSVFELGKEEHRVIFTSVLDDLDAMDIVVPDDAKKAWHKRTNSLISPRLRRAGFEPKKGEKAETALIRSELIKQSVRLADDKKTRENAVRIAADFLSDMTKVPTDIAGVALRIAAEDGSADLWLSYKMALAQAPTPAARNVLISGLGAFKDPELLKKSLALMLDGTMRSQDFWSLIGPTFRDPATFDVTWAWFTANYDQLVKRLGNKARRGLVSVGEGFCTPEGRKTVETFFSEPAHQAKGSDRNLANTLEHIDRCIAYRAYIQPGLEKNLK